MASQGVEEVERRRREKRTVKGNWAESEIALSPSLFLSLVRVSFLDQMRRGRREQEKTERERCRDMIEHPTAAAVAASSLRAWRPPAELAALGTGSSCTAAVLCALACVHASTGKSERRRAGGGGRKSLLPLSLSLLLSFLRRQMKNDGLAQALFNRNGRAHTHFLSFGRSKMYMYVMPMHAVQDGVAVGEPDACACACAYRLRLPPAPMHTH